MQIGIIIRGKIARLVDEAFAVCGNSDYVIHFDFDSEWDAYETKTARFKYNGSYTDVVFTGTECAMPIIQNANKVEIGVFAGELHTTTPATLIMKKSILCGSETESSVSQEIKSEFEKLLDEKIAQPDWNQNDETAPDYVKNRTHYTEISEQSYGVRP